MGYTKNKRIKELAIVKFMQKNSAAIGKLLINHPID
jgi:hypothetical protein